jgi:hypothetical protein
MQCTTPYVAVVSERDEFIEVYDRQAVAQRIANYVNDAVAAQGESEIPNAAKPPRSGRRRQDQVLQTPGS